MLDRAKHIQNFLKPELVEFLTNYIYLCKKVSETSNTNKYLEGDGQVSGAKFVTYGDIAIDSLLETYFPKIQEVWDTIEKERVTGYQHRAPKRRNDRSKQKILGKPPASKFSDIIKNDGEQLFVLDKNDKPVIRIRTESFDEKEKIQLKKIETEKIET